MTGLAKRVDLKNLGKTRKLYQKQRDRRFKQGLKAATPHSPIFAHHLEILLFQIIS